VDPKALEANCRAALAAHTRAVEEFQSATADVIRSLTANIELTDQQLGREWHARAAMLKFRDDVARLRKVRVLPRRAIRPATWDGIAVDVEHIREPTRRSRSRR
jgi:hypothetical protein